MNNVVNVNVHNLKEQEQIYSYLAASINKWVQHSNECSMRNPVVCKNIPESCKMEQTAHEAYINSK